jgi:hypothetical protein
MRAARIGAASCVVAVGACVEEPQPYVCPAVDPGALVITELRGPQSEPDTRGQWLELANVSGGTVDLQGLHVIAYQLDGTNEMDGIVRYKREVDDDDRFVVGKFTVGTAMPEWIDLDFNNEWPSVLSADGIVELQACGEIVDRIIYHALPGTGTYSLGLEPPDADGNDDEDTWCNDITPPPDGPMTELGLPGTPGEVNNPCV